MLSLEEFQQLATLSRLDPEDRELAGLRDDFNKILEHVKRINEMQVDQEDVVAERRNVLRADEPRPTLDVAALAQMAPVWESGHFVVPEVIDSEG